MSYSEPLINQPRVLFFSIGVGVLLCIFYVFLQGFFRFFGYGKLSYYCADVIFCAVSALISFFFMVLYNNGRVRLHLILGEAAGFFLFYFSSGRYISSALEKTADIIHKAVALFLKPYKFIFASFTSGVKRNFKRLTSKTEAFFLKSKAV